MQFGDGNQFVVVSDERFAFLKADARIDDTRCFFQSLLDRAGTPASSHFGNADGCSFNGGWNAQDTECNYDCQNG